MKGIILAGGTGSRLFPLTKVTNKHLLPVGKYPMIFYPIARLKEAGIEEILVVTGREHMGDVVSLLGSGCDYGLRFTFKVQDQAGGIAQALGLAENFVGGDRCVVLLGDNIFSGSIAPYAEHFRRQERGARVLIKQVPDPSRFGVAEIDGDRIIGIEEKPGKPKTDYAVTGIYMYDDQVFDIIRDLQPSARGELEITDVNNYYIRTGQMSYDMLQGWWSDAGTFPSLKRANELAADMELPL